MGGQGAARLEWSTLTLSAVLIATLIAAPVLSVFSNVFIGGTSDTWGHLADTVLGEFVVNTVILCVGVGLGDLLDQLFDEQQECPDY